MTIDKVSRIVHDWCKSKSFVNRAWLFGSQISNKHRPDSDIDVGVESRYVENTWSEGLDYYSAVSDVHRWQPELQKLIALKVHYSYMSYKEDSPGAESVRKDGILVYDVRTETFTKGKIRRA